MKVYTPNYLAVNSKEINEIEELEDKRGNSHFYSIYICIGILTRMHSCFTYIILN